MLGEDIGGCCEKRVQERGWRGAERWLQGSEKGGVVWSECAFECAFNARQRIVAVSTDAKCPMPQRTPFRARCEMGGADG